MHAHNVSVGEKMVNMTLSIPEQLYKKIKEHSEINWSDIARHVFEDYLTKLEILDRLTAGSELTEKDALDIGEAIKKSMWKRYLKESK